jgi:NAD(P)-dependent dehydrogenase (short-subunit alcohol dehydrogenase family)
MPALDGSRILVAGGSHRVGRDLALDLADGGADVFVSYYTSVEPAERTRADIEARGRRSGVVRADAADPADMAAMVDAAADAFGGLDVYVHCPSGGFEPREAADVDELLWDSAMDSTAKGFMFAAQAARRVMVPTGGGVIVAITDVAGIQPWPRFAPHGAAKAAQIYLVKSLAAAWGRDGIRVCGVAPGPVLMPRGVKGNPDETVLGRLGDPADVAQAVRFCIEADFATGQNVIVDGGRILRP